MQRLLDKIRFRDPARASENIARLTQAISPEVQKGIRSLLASSPDPDAALHMLGRLQQERREAFDRLTASVAGLPFLITVFSYSRFLSEAVLKSPEWLEELIRSEDMDRVLSAEEYRERLEKQLDSERFLDPEASAIPSPLTLALFRRREILRILLRDVQGFCTLPETTEELSNLADAILETACVRIREDLVRRTAFRDAPGRVAKPRSAGSPSWRWESSAARS